MKIPIDLNEEFCAAREELGHTHTQAVEEAIALYVKKAKRITSDKPSPKTTRKNEG